MFKTKPAVRAAAVTPSDSTVLNYPRSLYIGGGGDVVVLLRDDTTPVTFAGVGGGSILPIEVTKVLVATTATSILALW